ncbi:uncharacterized protein [Macrobrachium rosenbergii]|uniref:uncharacterized protein n=1 Tax=Macrobrachium rosenbergii TaxID=79674 RepID=UPI0034D760D3
MSPLSRRGASPNNLVSAGNQLLLHILVGGIVLLHFEIRHSLAFSVPLDGSAKTSRTSSTKSPNSPEEIEAFVKTLEYEATNGDNASQNDLIKIDLNLLDDDTIGLEIQDGLQEEFEVVDEVQKETSNASVTEKPGPSSRQLSLIYQGVYAPDSRFNAFADGVMVNMVAEMKRKRMDPLYFRVYDRGIVEHVTARAGREGMKDGPAAVSPTVDEDGATSRQGRQRGNAIGGGVIRGLTNTKRFGNAEVQIAGNATLVRAHWLTGPLDLIVDYRAPPSITRVRTGIQAVQFDTLTVVDRFGAEMSDFKIISPLFDYMPYYGNRTLEQQRTTEQVVRHLFSNDSFMTVLMKDSFEIASYDKIIPQFGTESNYYSVLKYLFDGAQSGNVRTYQPAASKGISLPGIPSLVAAHLADTAESAVDKRGQQ